MTSASLERLDRGLKKWMTDYHNLSEEVQDYSKRAGQTTFARDLDFIAEEIGRVNNWLDWLNEATTLMDAYTPQNQAESDKKRELVVKIVEAGLSMLRTRRRFRTAESMLRLQASRQP